MSAIEDQDENKIRKRGSGKVDVEDSDQIVDQLDTMDEQSLYEYHSHHHLVLVNLNSTQTIEISPSELLFLGHCWVPSFPCPISISD